MALLPSGSNHNPFLSDCPLCTMKSATSIILLLAVTCFSVFVAGCTSDKPAVTPSLPVTTVTTTAGAAVIPAATAGQIAPGCPDKLVWDGTWDSRELGYASNHDVREVSWNDAGPVPVSLTQECRDVTGIFKKGDCEGKLVGTMERSVLSGEWTSVCTDPKDNSAGTFSVIMAADNQSFLGSMYIKDGYGPEAGFPPSWWGKKQ